jgi:protoheme IX farnesyltransferase
MIRDYYHLTKPGIIYGNALTAAAGFFIGAQGAVSWGLFLTTLVGISLIIGSGCVFNNYIDRDIDAKMHRTKDRALVQGRASLRGALVFGALLALAGSAALLFTNLLTLAVALAGLFVYVIIYSMWCKRSTLHATVIGAVAGAVPPVVGYTAATNTLDIGAVIVFLILFAWQVPHALAIAVRRFDDYKTAAIPVMPVTMGHNAAKVQMLGYSAIFLLATAALYFTGYVGIVFFSIMSALAAVWLLLCAYGFWAPDDKLWAKRVFLYSLTLLLAFCLLSAFDSILF